MQLEPIMSNEINETHKLKNHMVSLFYEKLKV